MASICFINAYETSYLGTRVLASYLQANGHNTHNILLGAGEYITIDEALEKHEGYQAYSHGCLSVNKATKYKISDDDLDLLSKIIEAEHPDAIGFSARSTNNWLISYIVPVLKKYAPNALLIAGGFGPTLEPVLYLDGGFDVVVRCDGEEALLEIMNYIDIETQIKMINNNKYSILNTVWKKNDKIIYNNLRDQEKNLSKYGEPLHGHKYFSFINEGIMRRFYDPEIENGMYYTYFGRGCIGHCTYCSGGQWSSLYKDDQKKVYKRRNREISEVITELLKISEKSNHIWFVDEFFGLSSQKTIEFCDLYKKEIQKTFFCYINYNYMLEHKEIFYKMVDAGLIGTGVGFQTGSEKFARECYHRNLSNELLLEFTKLCYETGLYTGIHIIGGNCYESEEIFQDTVNLVRRLPFSIEDPWRIPLENIRLRPHPKTPITYLFPNVITKPMSAKEWFYRGVLLELSRILDLEEFEDIKSEIKWKSDPSSLNKHFNELLIMKQREHFKNLVSELQNKRVVFYGAGDLYKKNKYLFKQIKPEAFIIDEKFPIPNHIDNIPCYYTDDFLKNSANEDIEYIIFIKSTSKHRIKLHFGYNISNKHIHSCTSFL